MVSFRRSRSALGRADCIDVPAIYLSTLLRISLMHERRCRRPSTVSERAVLSKNTRGAVACVCEVLSNVVLKPVFYLKKMKKRNKKKKNKKVRHRAAAFR